MPRMAWIVIFLFVLSYEVGMAGVYYHAQLFLFDRGACEFFSQAGLEWRSS
jgi:hypothetical protein